MKYDLFKNFFGAGISPIWFLRKNEVPIFMFHRVLSSNNTNKPIDKYIYIEEDKFEQVLITLKKYFQISCLKTYLEQKFIPDNKCCFITFDDGWIDNYTVAFPILKKYNIPATIFIPTGMIGTKLSFWFSRLEEMINSSNNLDNLSAIFRNHFRFLNKKNETGSIKEELYFNVCNFLKKMDLSSINRTLDHIESDINLKKNELEERVLIDWEEVEEMGKHKISFGSHCVNHSILPNLHRIDKKFEINQSRKDLLDKKVNFVNCLSFPNGNYDQETLNIATEAGYSLFLSASHNKCGEGYSPRLAHRINITNYNSEKSSLFFSLFKAKIKKPFFKVSEPYLKND